MRLFVLLLANLWIFGTLVAQPDLRTDYEPLQSQAPIPRNILTDAYQKTAREISESGRKKRVEKDYTETVNYALDQLLRSPYVLFNTSINQYCDRLLDRLCADQPRLRKRLTVYLVRSSAVNAFATDRGDIFITMALLDRLRNEDELAFILAHEVIHARERHAMQNFDFAVDSDHDYSESSTGELLRQAQFSQDRETEADMEGLELYLAAGFDPHAPVRVLQLLDAAATIPDRWQFDSTQLAAYDLVPGAYETAPERKESDIVLDKYLAKANKNKDRDSQEDNREDLSSEEVFGSHPATRTRIAAVRERVTDLEPSQLPHDSTAFQSLLEQVHFELLETYNLEGLSTAALYQAYWLRERYPNNAWIEESLLYALYVMGQQASQGQSLVLEDYDSAGEFGRLIDYLGYTDKTERALAAITTLAKAVDPTDSESFAALLYRDAVEDLRYHDHFDPRVFEEPSNDSLSRYAQFREPFRTLLQDSTFLRHLENGEEFYERNPENMEMAARRKYLAERKQYRDRKLRSGYRLGQESVVVVEPRHFSLDRQGELMLEKSERRENRLRENLRDVSSRHPLQLDVLDARSQMRSSAIEDYRDSRLMTQWIGQLLGNGFRVPRNHMRVLEVQQRRDDPVFMFYLSLRHHGNYNTLLDVPLIGLTVLVPPLLGVSIPLRGLATPLNRSFILIIDPSSFQTLMRQEYRQRLMGSNAAQRQSLYWILDQINQRP